MIKQEEIMKNQMSNPFEVLSDQLNKVLGELAEVKTVLQKISPRQDVGKEYYNTKEAAKYLGISPATLANKSSQGLISKFKRNNANYYKKSTLDAWLVANTREIPSIGGYLNDKVK